VRNFVLNTINVVLAQNVRTIYHTNKTYRCANSHYRCKHNLYGFLFGRHGGQVLTSYVTFFSGIPQKDSGILVVQMARTDVRTAITDVSTTCTNFDFGRHGGQVLTSYVTFFSGIPQKVSGILLGQMTARVSP